MRVRVEVCVADLAEARAAAALGVDSLEACAWLACGGITPATALVRRMGGLGPSLLRVLCRPGPGGFVYGDDERALLMEEADGFDALPEAHGLVLGALDPGGRAEPTLIAAARRWTKELTFHRAIDHATDPLGVLEQVVEHGFSRILTSGGATLALDGASQLKRLVDSAAGRIRIAAAGGINPANVVELVQRTGVSEVHFAAQKPALRKSEGASMSSAHAGMSFETEPDAAKIEGVLNALAKAGLR